MRVQEVTDGVMISDGNDTIFVEEDEVRELRKKLEEVEQ